MTAHDAPFIMNLAKEDEILRQFAIIQISKEAMNSAIRLEGISKYFLIHHERSRSFQEIFVNALHSRRTSDTEVFWALREVSFDLQHGDSLAIIGQNGAGKSTLLKIITRIITPTSGQVHLNGRISALLELGAGFHPELSGRDNIFLNASLLGLKRKQIKAKLDEIVAFAELEQFIDTPVKHYSSGMYARLGFAIAIHFDPDILIVDEILSVGDVSFRHKCTEKIAEFCRNGQTMIFVSHDLASVPQVCSKAIWLEHGQVKEYGPAAEVVEIYRASVTEPTAEAAPLFTAESDEIKQDKPEVAATNHLFTVAETVQPAQAVLTRDLALPTTIVPPAAPDNNGSTGTITPPQAEREQNRETDRIEHLELELARQITAYAALEQQYLHAQSRLKTKEKKLEHVEKLMIELQVKAEESQRYLNQLLTLQESLDNPSTNQQEPPSRQQQARHAFKQATLAQLAGDRATARLYFAIAYLYDPECVRLAGSAPFVSEAFDGRDELELLQTLHRRLETGEEPRDDVFRSWAEARNYVLTLETELKRHSEHQQEITEYVRTLETQLAELKLSQQEAAMYLRKLEAELADRNHLQQESAADQQNLEKHLVELG